MHFEIEREKERENWWDPLFFLSPFFRFILMFVYDCQLGIGTPRSFCLCYSARELFCVCENILHICWRETEGHRGNNGIDGGKHIWRKYVQLHVAFIVLALENVWHLYYFHFFVAHVNAIYNQLNAWSHTHKNTLWKNSYWIPGAWMLDINTIETQRQTDAQYSIV